MIYTTKDQRKALKRVYERIVNDAQAGGWPVDSGEAAAYFGLPGLKVKARSVPTYHAFRRTVEGGPGCIMVPFAGMWLGIEPDGYTHS